jgi:site-specific DNA-methyltransferase (adenine-specific)
MFTIEKLKELKVPYKVYNNGQITIINADCMAIMNLFDDNEVDLVCCDPPYGIDIAKTGKVGGKNLAKATDYGAKDWDIKPPSKKLFDEMLKISTNQIIFGANHFISKIPYDSSCWIVWDKDNSGNFADSELAWTSFKTAVKNYKYRWNGMIQQDMKHKEERQHPTQKPVGLFKKILESYSQKNDLIFDGFLGSGTTALACLKTNRRCIGVELDEDYFKIACDRIEKQLQSPTLFGGF